VRSNRESKGHGIDIPVGAPVARRYGRFHPVVVDFAFEVEGFAVSFEVDTAGGA
jgi:hypothetical protein